MDSFLEPSLHPVNVHVVRAVMKVLFDEGEPHDENS